MMNFSMTFKQLTTGLGFTEVYNISGTDVVAELEKYKPGGPNAYILTQRTAFLSSDLAIARLKFSAISATRASKFYVFPVPVTGLQSEKSGDIDDSLVYFGFSTNSTSKRQFHLRGIPNTWIRQSDLTATGEGNLPTVLTFLNSMLNVGGMKILSPIYTVNTTFGSVTKAAMADPIVLTTDVAITLSAPALIEIVGCRSFPALNGRWIGTTPSSAPSNQLTIQASQRLAPPTTVNGKVRVLNYAGTSGITIASIEYNSVGERKTGRYPFLRRGRRAARIRHR